MKHKPLSLQELKKLRAPLQSANLRYREKLTRLEKFALLVTEKIGTIGFFLIIFAWTVFWVGWNALAPANLRFDPLPAFALWLFIANMIQLLLMPLIMIGQNLQAKHAQTRAEADFEVNIKAERDIEVILQHLENQSELMEQTIKRLEENTTGKK